MNRSVFLLSAIATLIALSQPALAQRRAGGDVMVPRPRSGGPVNAPNARGVSPTWSKMARPELLKSLRAGGYVICFRHSATDWRGSDQLPQRGFEDRSTQRQLSEQGKTDAKKIGASFRSLGIPIGAVYASPYFRTRDFAQLAFGKGEVTYNLLGTNPEHIEGYRNLLSTAPKPGTNTILSGHQLGLIKMGIFKTNELEEGNCGVFKPLGGGKFELVAHLAPKDWAGMEATK